MVLYSLFQTGLEGETAKDANLRQAERYPAGQHLRRDRRTSGQPSWTTKLLGEDVQGKYAELKQASADRCPRRSARSSSRSEIQFHHEVDNQYLWNQF